MRIDNFFGHSGVLAGMIEREVEAIQTSYVYARYIVGWRVSRTAQASFVLGRIRTRPGRDIGKVEIHSMFGASAWNRRLT
jgi:hypothetical protein